MTSSWRKFHFWLGAVVVAQVLLWLISGVGFTFITHQNTSGMAESRWMKTRPLPPPELIHRTPTPLPPLDFSAVRIMPWQVRDLLRESNLADARLEEVVLFGHGLRGRPMYLVRVEGLPDPFVFDAATGHAAPRLTAEEAQEIARRDYDGPGEVRDVEWITEKYQKGADYYGELPVHRVNFTNAKQTRIYISPVTGQILMRRNIHKTFFDAFFAVHMFTYVNRTIAGNPGILIAGGISLLAVLSGILLYFPRFRSKTANGSPSEATPRPAVARRPVA